MMTTAYLIHGTSTRDDDWFPWLEEALAPAVKLERLWLPNPFAPMQAAWDSALEDQIKPADGLTLVAYSLPMVGSALLLFDHVIPCHRQVLTRRPLGNQVLDDVDVTGLKGRRAGLQVKFPHPHEAFAHHFGDLSGLGLEVLVPKLQGPLVVAAQHFHVVDL